MCWNERTSWTTFLAGTFVNMYIFTNYKQSNIRIVSLLWEFVLLMQFFEALAWRDQECGKLNRFATKGAMIANVLQPVVIYVLLINYTPVSPILKITASLITLAYISYIILSLNKAQPYSCLHPSKTCDHIQYPWWDDIPGRGLWYGITISLLILLLLRPFGLATFELGFIFIALFLSMKFYSCGTPSVWCWFAASAPLITLIYLKINN